MYRFKGLKEINGVIREVWVVSETLEMLWTAVQSRLSDFDSWAVEERTSGYWKSFAISFRCN